MGKKLITERFVSELYQQGKTEVVVSPGHLLAPLAKDFATSKRMKIVYGAATECPLNLATDSAKEVDIDEKIKKILEDDFSIQDKELMKTLIGKIKAEI